MNNHIEPIVKFLTDIEFFSCFNLSEMRQLANQVQILNFAFGDTIITAEDNSEGMYVIHSGMVRLFKLENGKETSHGIRKKEQVFAELGALRTIKHEYSVRASAKVELFFIARKHILNLLVDKPENELFLTRYIALSTAGGIISQLFQLKSKVDRKESKDYISRIGIKKVNQGALILNQGSTDDLRLYVVRHGSVNLVRNEEGTDYPVATLKPGELFGEANKDI